MTVHERRLEAIRWDPDGTVTAIRAWEAIDDAPAPPALEAADEWAERRAAARQRQAITNRVLVALIAASMTGLCGVAAVLAG